MNARGTFDEPHKKFTAHVIDMTCAVHRDEYSAGCGSPLPLQRYDNLAEMLIGIHALERLADVIEGKHLVDRQLQLA